MRYPNPYGSQILVRPDEAIESDVITPDVAREAPQEGVVLAVGDKVNIITPGMKVWFTKTAGHEVDIEGEKLLVMDTMDKSVFLYV